MDAQENQHAEPFSRLVAACEPGWEGAVGDEIKRRFVSAQLHALPAGWIEARISPDELADTSTHRVTAFARQVLPNAMEVAAPSISKLASLIAAEVGQQLDALPGPWRCHVFNNALTQPEIMTANPGRGADAQQKKPRRSAPSSEPIGGRRCGLIQEAVFEQLERRYRRLAKRGHTESRATFAADESYVQFALVNVDRGFLSVLPPQQVHEWQHSISGWSGGDLEVPQDRLAPSRACQKLYEAELRWGRPVQRGEVCVDLGSSPGGWAWVALRRGASVTAVDRSPLREDLMEHSRLTFVRGDAFKFAPQQPVDWLFSDVIAFPSRILELLTQWLSQRWCRRFCVTIKFQGRDDDAILTDFAQMLAAHTTSFALRRLKVNKNEVTAYGEVAGFTS